LLRGPRTDNLKGSGSFSMPSPKKRRYASLAKAAKYADSSARALRNHIDSGDITGYRLGRDYRIDLNELDLWMARDAIRREAEADPPLSPEVRARLAVLLQQSGSDAA
jgi:excisionase family DNA binding protein